MTIKKLPKHKTALIVGSTGLVGSHLLQQLLDDANYDRIISVGRKPSGQINSKLKEIQVNFEELQTIKKELIAEDVFCCLGTTLKKAGSRDAFKKVDLEYPVDLARIVKENGTTHFVLITALGSNKRSPFFYNQVKGEVEEQIKSLEFDHLTIVRPALILGDRKEQRWVENFGKWMINSFQFVLIGPFRKYRGNHAEKIAESMRIAALKTEEKVNIISSGEMV